LRDERIDAVLAEFGPTGARVAEACANAQTPLLVHFHGSDAYKDRWLTTYRERYERMFSLAGAILAVSQDMVERLVKLGAPRHKVFWSPCGVDLDSFHGGDPGHAPPTLIYVGRFVEKKGPHLALIAFREALRQHPQARLVMIGDGPLWEACQQLAQAFGIQKAVSFSGVLSHLEVAQAMRGARALVLPSLRTINGDMEGTPVSILEAAATGLPVLSTRHGGIPEAVLQGETGFLVEEGDVSALAEIMRSVLDSPELASQLGRQAREHMQARYAMGKRTAELMAIAERTIAGELRPGNSGRP
jgi:glycosyltransferase involved in cell wall biosynthesis